ncbi:MAG: hypothetical protein Q8N96_05025 [Methylovulum sp.]|nr:hypothetical protein [Methylovulum sp.]
MVEQLYGGCGLAFNSFKVEHRVVDHDFVEQYEIQYDPIENQQICFLDWHDYIIVHLKKGICCISRGQARYFLNDTLEELSETILPDRIVLIFDDSIDNALNHAQEELSNWEDSIQYELGSAQITAYLREIMQIDSLPPASFNGKISINDERFMRLSRDIGLIGLISPELELRRANPLHLINIQVNTCAGSGKTIAAIYAYRLFKKIPLKTLFVCFNHLLGNWLRDDLNPKSENGYVGTFYHFACRELQHHFENPTYGGAGDHARVLLEKLKNNTYTIPDNRKFDALIIDEGQDFIQEWIELFPYVMKPHAIVLFFEDSQQNISGYHHPIDKTIFDRIAGRDAWIIANTPTTPEIELIPNLRTPQQIDRFIRCFFNNYDSILIDNITPSQNRINGFNPRINFYEEGDLLNHLENRIDDIIRCGIDKRNIVIVSCLSSGGGSVLLNKRPKSHPFADFTYQIKQIGEYALQRETGCYGNNAHKIYRDINGIRCDSINKYKGMEDAIVLVIDVERPDNIDRYNWAKRLYCAFTRATLGLEVFVRINGNMVNYFNADH